MAWRYQASGRRAVLGVQVKHYHSSALPRIMLCNGSVALVEQAPKSDHTDDAAEGTAFHHFAAELLKGRGPLRAGDTAPNGHILDDEMLEHARDYAARLKNADDWVQRVEAPMHWGPGGKANDAQPWQVRVKCDAVTWRPDISTLAVTDAKYGFRYVDAANNWQLLSQAVGACFALNIQPRRIILAIYQPRGPGEALRWVELTALELLASYTEMCATLSNLTAALNTNPYCRHCAAANGCPANERAMFNAIDVSMDSGTYEPKPATYAARLELVERASEFLKQSQKWLEASALADLKAGKPVPGLATKAILGNTVWKDQTFAPLRNLQSPNQRFFDEVPVTPAEALRRGMTKEDYAALTHRPARGVKLIKSKDGAKQAAEVFGDKPKMD